MYGVRVRKWKARTRRVTEGVDIYTIWVATCQHSTPTFCPAHHVIMKANKKRRGIDKEFVRFKRMRRAGVVCALLANASAFHEPGPSQPAGTSHGTLVCTLVNSTTNAHSLAVRHGAHDKITFNNTHAERSSSSPEAYSPIILQYGSYRGSYDSNMSQQQQYTFSSSYPSPSSYLHNDNYSSGSCPHGTCAWKQDPSMGRKAVVAHPMPSLLLLSITKAVTYIHMYFKLLSNVWGTHKRVAAVSEGGGNLHLLGSFEG
ncbi:hypothetical protein BDQ17DRAFT_1335741 [Cyathus striatus]|nr:hypothetical protein BDQ17DRAFT_1335741 [Cyathus striatus]